MHGIATIKKHNAKDTSRLSNYEKSVTPKRPVDAKETLSAQEKRIRKGK